MAASLNSDPDEDDFMTMRSTIRSTAAAALLIVAVAAPARADFGFSDVESDTYYTEPVGWLVHRDITTGVEPGCFAPGEYVTRGQIAAFLFRYDRAAGGDPTGGDHPFVDVVSPYQQTPVAWLYEQQITTGTSPNTFSPDLALTRGELAALLWRYVGQPEVTTTHRFNDVTRDWQAVAISWLVSDRLTTGTSPTTYSPDDPVTRAQAAAFLWRLAGEPDAPARFNADATCERELREALVGGGLTHSEAACTAEFLTEFTIAELETVLAGATQPSTALLFAVSDASSACFSTDRIAELIRRFY